MDGIRNDFCLSALFISSSIVFILLILFLFPSLCFILLVSFPFFSPLFMSFLAPFVLDIDHDIVYNEECIEAQ